MQPHPITSFAPTITPQPEEETILFMCALMPRPLNPLNIVSDLRVTTLPAAKVHVNFLELCFTAQLISQSSAHWAISAEAEHTLTQVEREP